MKSFKQGILAFIFLAASSFFALSAQASELEHLLDSMHSMQADFIQTIYDNRGKAIQKSNGKMAFERPGKFRWQVIKPIPQLVIANGTRLWIYDSDLEQVTIKSLHRVAGETPALLLSHSNTSLDKDFEIKQINGKPETWQWFALSERKPDSTFAAIQLAFDAGQIKEMRLEDHLGHTTKIQFQHAKVNTTLSSASFVFNAPAKVDIIDETQLKK